MNPCNSMTYCVACVAHRERLGIWWNDPGMAAGKGLAKRRGDWAIASSKTISHGNAL